jgi:hypothetical protein
MFFFEKHFAPSADLKQGGSAMKGIHLEGAAVFYCRETRKLPQADSR